MKFQITLKAPDGVNEALARAADRMCLEDIRTSPDADQSEEVEAVLSEFTEQAETLCDRWFSYREFLTVEIDTEAETIRVVPREGR